MTTRQLERPLSIRVDGKELSQPLIRQAITTGKAVITGDYDRQKASELAACLGSGALPAGLRVERRQGFARSGGVRQHARDCGFDRDA